MFNESLNLAIVHTELDRLFFESFDNISPQTLCKTDFDYEAYNKYRLEKYNREDREQRFKMNIIIWALVILIVMLFVYA